MSYCLNPKCPNPSDLSNNNRDICRHCGSELLVRGRYRVVRPLGGGGFGKTFEVDDQGNLKVLKILYKNHPKAVELFKHEATILSRLSHPGIPKVEADGYFTYLPNNFKEPLHCLVMEKIQGLNLEEWMKQRNNKPLSQEEAVDCLKKVTEILDKVHQQQFFHRDIKPLNIMRRPNGQLVLIDFGAAREVTGTYLAKVGQGQNVTGIVSPGYTPPEQVNGKAVPQSDFYALGRTFIYLITALAPTAFPENPRTGKLIWRDKAPQISPELGDIIDYLMAPFPGNRPQNAQMLIQCLAEIDPNNKTSGGPHSGFTKPRLSSNSSLSSGRTAGSPKNTVGKPVNSFSKNRPKPASSKKNVKKLAFNILLALLCGLGVTQLFAYFRYGDFPANPIRTLASIPSTQFLQKTIRGSEVGAVTTVAINPTRLNEKQKSELIIFASGTFRDIRLWELPGGQRLHNFIGHNSWIRALTISSNGKLMASGGDDRTIRLWDIEKRFRMRSVANTHSDAVTALAITPKGDTLVSGSRDKTIRLWRLPSVNRFLTISAHNGPVNALVITPNGKILASASDDRTVKLWNLDTGKSLRTLKGHKGAVLSLAISPNGKILASGSADGTIRLWDMATGKLRNVLEGHSSPIVSLAMTPDGKILASAGDNIKLWNLATAKLAHTLVAPDEAVSTIAISPDGQTLLAGSRDRTVKVWRIP
ncbi:MAG TPA: serine/threonine-protein kinase [Halomicronema sp.]